MVIANAPAKLQLWNLVFQVTPIEGHSAAVFVNRTIVYNAYNDLHNRQNTQLTKTNPYQPQKHGFPHCPTNAKTIVRTKKPIPANQ